MLVAGDDIQDMLNNQEITGSWVTDPGEFHSFVHQIQLYLITNNSTSGLFERFGAM